MKTGSERFQNTRAVKHSHGKDFYTSYEKLDNYFIKNIKNCQISFL